MSAPREPDPAAPPLPARPRSLALALALTLAAPLLLLLTERVPLPGIDESTLPAEGLLHAHSNMSVGALGIMPFISATYLVEIAALVVPAWRPLRHGGPEGRQKLGRAALILALGLAVFQGYNAARLLTTLPDFGSPSIPLVTLTLVAAVGITHLFCEAVSRYGLASGYGAISAGIPFLALFAPLEGRTAGAFATRDLAVLLAAIAGLAAITWFMLERGAPKISSLKKAESYRKAGNAEEDAPLWLPAPSSGLAPSTVVPSLLMLPVTLGAIWPSQGGLGIVLHTPLHYQAVCLSLVFGAALLFTRLFNQPGRIAEVFSRARGAGASRAKLAAEASSLLRPAAMRSVLFLFAVMAIELLAFWASPRIAAVSATPLFVALLLDITAELRARRMQPDLVTVWPEHSPYAIAAAREALHAEGIFLYARGERMRRLLQFFGPYVPLDLMVPENDAKRAEEILRDVLQSRTAAKETNPILNEEARSKARPIGGAVVAALVSLAGLMLGLTVLPTNEPPIPEKRSVSLAFVAVDDDREVIDEAAMRKLPAEKLPRGLRFAKEQVSIGPGKQAVREYAWLIRNDTETMEDARARLEAWTKTLVIPEGDHVAVAEFLEYNDGKEAFEVIGFRAYLLKGAPVLTEADVADAQAMPDASNGGTGWLVRLTFTPQGAARFESYTAENIKRRFAIVVDGKVMSAPVIQSRIPGGVVTITMGSASVEKQKADAKELATALGGK